ncbi:hypothetical protein ACSS6W_008403 [Trichoderma asperelloides]
MTLFSNHFQSHPKSLTTSEKNAQKTVVLCPLVLRQVQNVSRSIVGPEYPSIPHRII